MRLVLCLCVLFSLSAHASSSLNRDLRSLRFTVLQNQQEYWQSPRGGQPIYTNFESYDGQYKLLTEDIHELVPLLEEAQISANQFESLFNRMRKALGVEAIGENEMGRCVKTVIATLKLYNEINKTKSVSFTKLFQAYTAALQAFEASDMASFLTSHRFDRSDAQILFSTTWQEQQHRQYLYFESFRPAVLALLGHPELTQEKLAKLINKMGQSVMENIYANEKQIMDYDPGLKELLHAYKQARISIVVKVLKNARLINDCESALMSSLE